MSWQSLLPSNSSCLLHGSLSHTASLHHTRRPCDRSRHSKKVLDSLTQPKRTIETAPLPNSRLPAPCRSLLMAACYPQEKSTRRRQLARRRRNGARTSTLPSFAPTVKNTLRTLSKSSAQVILSAAHAAVFWASAESTLEVNGGRSVTTIKVRACRNCR
jgi:hypothetical protein